MNHQTPKPSGIEPLQASAQEFGGEISEEELVDGFSAPLPDDLVISKLPKFDPEEIESSYICFLS